MGRSGFRMNWGAGAAIFALAFVMTSSCTRDARAEPFVGEMEVPTWKASTLTVPAACSIKYRLAPGAQMLAGCLVLDPAAAGIVQVVSGSAQVSGTLVRTWPKPFIATVRLRNDSPTEARGYARVEVF